MEFTVMFEPISLAKTSTPFMFKPFAVIVPVTRKLPLILPVSTEPTVELILPLASMEMF